MILSFVMALRSISANKLRAVLTMLGIIIGVMALVVLVSLVSGATASVTEAVAGLGSSMLTVEISDDHGNPVTLDTLDRWMELDRVGSIAPYAMDGAIARYGSISEGVSICGIAGAYDQVQGLQLCMGRWLRRTDVENHSYVCVLNETAAVELIGYVDCVGYEIMLNGIPYTVVGVLQNNEDNLTSFIAAGTMTVYLPYTTLVRLSGKVTQRITSFYVTAPEGSALDDTRSVMEQLLLDRFEQDADSYQIKSQNTLEETMNSITSVLSILLGGIAAISLVVGGIGIMNIMLVTVTERTREIGIRKAIGASRGTILTQFLMEAVVLCMLGCCLGIFLSWAILQLVTTVVSSLNMSFGLDGGVVMIAVVFCFFIGVIFGLYPANKAAKMKPIDALHYGG